MKIIQSQFDGGLALGPPVDKIGEGFTSRNKGMHYLSYGSFRSRFGSSLLSTLDAHSITYFADNYYYGVGTSFYRVGASINTGLSGDNISFAKMPPTAGVTDYLFCAEGSDLFKSDSSGNITDWGFDAPASNPSAAAAAGGSLADATWGYQITYYNSTTGHRSNGNGTTVYATTSGGNNSVALTSIPDPTGIDPQISHVEIWRTVAGGSILFRLDLISAGTTTYTDAGSESLSSTELPTDNFKPLDTFFNCLGPHNASMFWLSNAVGSRGRIYYSPIGRAESYSGFINVCENDSPLRRLFLFQSQLGVIGEAGVYIISGTSPYFSRQISGCPGTTSPDTVAVIPNVGLMYEASDGIRLFDGATAPLVTPGAVDRLFRGESAGDFTSFSGTCAAFCRNEYIISDDSQSLAFDLEKKRWRDLGVGISAIYYNQETDEIAANISGDVLSFEEQGQTDDNGTAISLSLSPPFISLENDEEQAWISLTLDINTNGGNVTLYKNINGSESSVGSFSTASRSKITFFIGSFGQLFGYRLAASLTAAVELFSANWRIDDYQTTGTDREAILQHVTIDIKTGTTEVTAKLKTDSGTTTLGSFTNATRTRTTIAVGATGNKFLVYLEGNSTTDEIELYSIDYIFNNNRYIKNKSGEMNVV